MRASENDAAIREARPVDDDERALAAIADWGPVEDWSDWRDAEGLARGNPRR